jgi:hypothetical protein
VAVPPLRDSGNAHGGLVMAALPNGTLRAPKGGDTVPLNAFLALAVEWDPSLRVPVDVTVTGPSGRSAEFRVEPLATVAGPEPVRHPIPLWHETDAKGQPARGRVTVETDNGEPAKGLTLGLFSA